MAILLPLTLAIYAAVEFLYRANVKQEAQLEPVSQMRRFRSRVFPAVYGAAMIYNSTSPPVVAAGSTINGRTFTFPANDGTPGDILMLAVPEDFTRPSTNTDDPTILNPAGLNPNGAPDGFPDGRYTLLAVYTEPVDSDKTSRLNRTARRIVVAEWESVTSATGNHEAPLTIDFTTLGNADRQRVFNVHGVENEFELILQRDQVSDGSGGFTEGTFITGVNLRQHCLYGNEQSDGNAAGNSVYDNQFDFTLQVRNTIGI